MHSFLFFLSALLSFNVCPSFAMPAANAQADSVTVITMTVVPVYATSTASAYPSSPTTNEFSYLNYDESKDEDKGDRFIVHSAFQPFSSILQATVDALSDKNNAVYDRWFPPTVVQGAGKPDLDGRGYVTSVFQRVFTPGSSPIPDPRVENLIHDNNDFASGCKTNVRAYTAPKRGVFHVCKPKGLALEMIANPTNCSVLGTEVSRNMDSLSSTLIHEFMHWIEVGDSVPNSVGHITDVKYGPLNCHNLKKGATLNSQKTFVNADSYKYMALNAYYNKVCGMTFADPIILVEDLQESQDELLGSPEYNATLSGGPQSIAALVIEATEASLFP